MSFTQNKYDVSKILYMNIKNKTMNKLKFNKTTNVLLLNNKTYIPHLLHQLPKKFSEFPLDTIIKLKGYVYICSSNFNNPKNIIENISHNWELGYKTRR